MGGYGWVSLTTDYGTSDGFVAVCHGVIARMAPDVRVIDVTHQVPAGEVTRAAHVLAQAVPHLPPSVHVAVVDPGVGTARRGIALATPAGLLVGPDNGLLPWAADALGGITAGVALTTPPGISRTFHGRDVFTPAAARLAAGGDLTAEGTQIDPDSVVRLPDPIVSSGDGWLEAEVVTIDRFGNVQLAATAEHLTGLPAEVSVGGVRARVGGTFADAAPGDLVVLVDSADRLAVAVNGGRASVVLSAIPGDVLRIVFHPPGHSSTV